MDEKLSDYKWSKDASSINNFICLHYDEYDPDYPCSFADSYESQIQNLINVDLDLNLGKKYSKYIQTLYQMGVDVNDIN